MHEKADRETGGPSRSQCQAEGDTIGHAVGAGSTTEPDDGLLREARVQLFPCPSAVAFRHQLYRPTSKRREYNDPHGIDEVPIERQDVNSIPCSCFDLPHQRKCEHDCEAEMANDHVKIVQSDNE